MRILMVTLCLFAALSLSAHAAELYRCLDLDGNIIITSTPQDGMKDCKLKDSSDDSAQDKREQKQYSPAATDRHSSPDDDKLRRQCAKLEHYRAEARTYCEGIPQSYKSNNEAMKKAAQDRMASSIGSASQNCDYYSGLVRELEAKCR